MAVSPMGYVETNGKKYLHKTHIKVTRTGTYLFIVTGKEAFLLLCLSEEL